MLSTGDSSHPAVDTTAPNPRHKHPSATSKVPAIWRAHADATGTAASHAIGTRAVASPGGSLASAFAWRERPARVGRHCSSRLSAIATTSSSVRPTARASSTSCLCTGCNAVGPSGAFVARPFRSCGAGPAIRSQPRQGVSRAHRGSDSNWELRDGSWRSARRAERVRAGLSPGRCG
jgi:hypothetical protein